MVEIIGLGLFKREREEGRWQMAEGRRRMASAS
jgi:hypothetical protein